MNSIATAMIVKNEAKCLSRCLASLRALDIRPVLVDTGSTDDTVAVAEAAGAIMYHRPWVNFGHNRSEAIDLARPHGDWLLRLDADQTIHGVLPELIADAAQVCVHHGTLRYYIPALMRSSKPWKYVGATHEYLDCAEPTTQQAASGLHIIEHGDSDRRRSGRKLPEDLALLKSDPTARGRFYYARTLDDLGRRGEAVLAYLEREQMGGWAEEVWYSRYRRAVLLRDTGALIALWSQHPQRWEAAYRACVLLNQADAFHAAYLISQDVMSRPGSPNGLFAESEVYTTLMWREHALALKKK